MVDDTVLDYCVYDLQGLRRSYIGISMHALRHANKTSTYTHTFIRTNTHTYIHIGIL